MLRIGFKTPLWTRFTHYAFDATQCIFDDGFCRNASCFDARVVASPKSDSTCSIWRCPASRILFDFVSDLGNREPSFLDHYSPRGLQIHRFDASTAALDASIKTFRFQQRYQQAVAQHDNGLYIPENNQRRLKAKRECPDNPACERST